MNLWFILELFAEMGLLRSRLGDLALHNEMRYSSSIGCRRRGFEGNPPMSPPPSSFGGFSPNARSGFFLVRPARAHPCGCKSRHELITASVAKRNCTRATECGKEAWSANCESMYKNRIEGVAEQGEQAKDCEALVIEARRRRFGGCAVKGCVLTRGDLALCLKGRW